MLFNPADSLDEFILSSYFQLCHSSLKEHAENILSTYCVSINKFSDDRDVRFEHHEKALKELLTVSLPSDAKKQIPSLLILFFQYLHESGKNPYASQWEKDIKLLEKEFIDRVRDDGSVKGETFTKKYEEVGRNDPCPCGSGKKFKKCCGQ